MDALKPTVRVVTDPAHQPLSELLVLDLGEVDDAEE